MISYRSGTRYNPDEEAFDKIQLSSPDPKYPKNNAHREKRKDNKRQAGNKRGQGTKENVDPKHKDETGEKSKCSELDVEKVLVENRPEGPFLIKPEMHIVSENPGADDTSSVERRNNININVDDYVDTGAIPKRALEN